MIDKSVFRQTAGQVRSSFALHAQQSAEREDVLELYIYDEIYAGREWVDWWTTREHEAGSAYIRKQIAAHPDCTEIHVYINSIGGDPFEAYAIAALLSRSGKTTYAQKTATAVTVLDPATYGALLANLAKTPTGRARTVRNVILVVSPADYFARVMPATTILTPQGTYVSDVLPFPTKVIQSAAMPEGKAVLGLAHRYGMRMGTNARGFIEYDDSVQFLEDNRVYTSHLYGNGRPLDNNAFEVLDISGLSAPVYTVRAVTPDAAAQDSAG